MNKLQIEKIEHRFKNNPILETQDIFALYQLEEANIKLAAVNWRINALVQAGILQRVGKGKFMLGENRVYIPEITSTIKSVYKKIKTEFPYLNLCIWNTSALNEFMLHQPNHFFTLIETDKEATEAVFYFFREKKIH